jgi:hypothetical protein
MNLGVSTENEKSGESWTEYFINHKEGTIYFHPAHLQVLEEQSGQKPLRLVCRD